MAGDSTKYTIVAAKALSLAELFKAAFAHGLDGPVRFQVELSAPDGPSTGGGKQALQHLKLVPDDGGPTIVIGSADTTRATAEIRTFDHVATLYAQRFHGTPFPVDPTRFTELTERLTGFFRNMNMQVSFAALDAGALASRARASTVPSAPAPSRGWLLPVIGVVLGLGLIGAAYAFIFLR